jgi:predicted nucleic acid-binding protein
MISAVDSSVLLDFLIPGSDSHELSKRHLRQAGRDGRLVVCECVIAELIPAFIDEKMVKQLLSELSIDFEPMCIDCSVQAGLFFRKYLQRKGSAKRVLPDFLIGAHALHHADRLLALDRGYLRDYFDTLIVEDPRESH